MALASRFSYSPVLPHNYTATINDIRTILTDIEETAEQEFDEIHEELDKLKSAVVEANTIINDQGATNTELATDAEDLQVRLGNLLIPALYMENDEYSHDPALPHQRLPYLRLAEKLPDLSGRKRRYAETSLQRGRNRLVHRVRQATEVTRQFVKQYS